MGAAFSANSPPCRVLLLGLDNCGKTTLLRQLVARHRASAAASSIGNAASGLATSSSMNAASARLASDPETAAEDEDETAMSASVEASDTRRVLPTLGHASEVVRLPQGGPDLALTEVGGRRVFRDFWRYHARLVEGVVFVVDSNDPARLEEARQFLFEVATSWELLGAPVLVLANKQDLPFALPGWQVAARLQTELLERLGHPTHVHRTVGLTGDGLVTALHVLAKFIRQRRRSPPC